MTIRQFPSCTLVARLLTALLCLGTPARHAFAQAVDSPSAQPIAVTRDAPSAATAGSETAANTNAVDAPGIKARIEQLEAATEAGEPQKAKLLDTYRQTLEQIEFAKANRGRADAFRKSIETAPSEIQRIRDEKSAIEANGAEDPLAGFTSRMTAQDAQHQLVQEQAGLTDLRARISDLEKRLVNEEARPAAARAEMGEAASALSQIEQELTAAAGPAEAPETERSLRNMLESRREARATQIQMLEQELLSNPARIDLLMARRDLLVRQISVGETKVRNLESKASELRQAESDRARMEADRLRRGALGKHELIQSQANENAEITRETQELGPLIDQTRQDRTEAEAQLEQIKSDLEEARRTLELDNITESVGALLLEQRRNLRANPNLKLGAEETRDTKALARLRLFKIDRQLKQLADLPKAVEQAMARVDVSTLAEDYRIELERELSEMLSTKREHLNQLAQVYRAYATELNQHEAVYEELTTISAQMMQLLDENLLWIRNAPALGLQTFLNLDDSLRGIFQPEAWHSLLGEIWSDVYGKAPLYLIFIILLALIVASRKNLFKRLEALAAPVGKPRQDRIGITVSTAFVTVLIAAPIAILILFAGWRLSSMQSGLATSLGSGAIACGIVYSFLRLTYAICRPTGLGEKHFRWNSADLVLLRRHLKWFFPVATILSFLVAFAESLADPVHLHTLGRMSFIALMLAAGVLAAVLFHPKRGLKLSIQQGTMTWTNRTQPLWRPVALVLTLGLALLAGMGYNYMALAIQNRLNQTVALVFGAAVVYAFFHRWLMISQRRLAMKLRLEKWEAERKSREEHGDDEAEINHVDIHDEIDVAEVKTQTIELLRMSMALALILSLWFTWAGVLPAFRILDNVTLWSQVSVVDGVETISAVTLTNLALSLVILGVTIVAARNFPGFLEIALLQRLPVDQGTRYATSTLTLYFIVTVGVVFAFMSIGIGWSSVQWLVAALTVGLGFGLQEIFGNFVSGLIILIERPIRVGDTVTVGSISGVVSRIRMRATTITDWNRKELVVPNKSFITGELINWSLSDPILRMDFVVGIAYGSNTTLAHQTMLKVCKEHPMVIDQPEPTVFFTGFGDNSLNFDVRVFVAETTNTARTRIVHDLHMAIDNAFRELNICIAFPQRDVHLDTLSPLEVRIQKVDKSTPTRDREISTPGLPEREEDPGKSR